MTRTREKERKGIKKEQKERKRKGSAIKRNEKGKCNVRKEMNQ